LDLRLALRQKWRWFVESAVAEVRIIASIVLVEDVLIG
jgi:hypothetical protein